MNVLENTEEMCHQAREAGTAVMAVQPDPSKWNITQLKIMLKSLKKKEDGTMNTLKEKMLEAYLLCKERGPPLFDEVIATMEAVVEETVVVEMLDEEDELTTVEEAVTAILSLFDREVVYIQRT